MVLSNLNPKSQSERAPQGRHIGLNPPRFEIVCPPR